MTFETVDFFLEKAIGYEFLNFSVPNQNKTITLNCVMGTLILI